MLKRTIAFSKRFADNPVSATTTFVNNRLADMKTVKSDYRSIKNHKKLDLLQILLVLAEHEQEKKTGPLNCGLIIEQHLLSDSGLKQILVNSDKALRNYPDSSLLLYLRTVALAHFGEHAAAHELISSAIIKSRLPSTLSHYGDKISTRRTVTFLKTWKVLDKIARDKMKWQNENSSFDNGYDKLSFLDSLDTKYSDNFDVQMALFSAEPLLEGKKEDKYLKRCLEIYNNIDSLPQKLSSIIAILKPGKRRLPNYHKSYKLAKKLYKELRPRWEYLLRPLDQGGSARNKDPKSVVKVLRMVQRLSADLGYKTDSELAINAMLSIATTPWGKSTKWLVARTVMEYEPIKYLDATTTLIKRGSEKPQSIQEIEHYMVWANHSQEYDEAIKFFEKQPNNVKRHRAGMAYVNILQRINRFHDASNIASQVIASQLVRPHNFCPITIWGIRQRVGELEFASETSDYYKMVPQPKNPKGLIFVTSRTLEQLRRTPLVVLIEWKRMGWAVIPLVEGLLPKELTGIPEIDAFNGCITLNRRLTNKSRASFNKIKNFNSKIDKGSLKWGNIDLSHALWEEATVNRRVYEVDFNCPLMKKYLGNITKWANSNAIVLSNIHDICKKLEIRTGFLISHNHRLPDALYRFYCEKYGNQDKFFCIHSANGYQNYFSNFSTNISSKAVIRNMTRYPMTRSASFPVPEKFDTYYAQNKSKVADILEIVKDVTKVNRSAVKDNDITQEAKLVLAQIRNWKEKGGKVACAFGKVVCDSSVPYDGGPVHKDMKDWINHTIECAKNSNTLLLIKPHPHEHKEEIACFINAYFEDLIEKKLPKNVIILGHRWFNIHMLKEFVDLGLIYNGTTAVELGILGIPSILCAHFAPIDYPVGHITPKSRLDYKKYVRFDKKAIVSSDLKFKSACWIYYMNSDNINQDYRYHARQITNVNLYPSYWFKEDITSYFMNGDTSVTKLALSAISK
jgi:hypothetical protein